MNWSWWHTQAQQADKQHSVSDGDEIWLNCSLSLFLSFPFFLSVTPTLTHSLTLAPSLSTLTPSLIPPRLSMCDSIQHCSFSSISLTWSFLTMSPYLSVVRSSSDPLAFLSISPALSLYKLHFSHISSGLYPCHPLSRPSLFFDSPIISTLLTCHCHEWHAVLTSETHDANKET